MLTLHLNKKEYTFPNQWDELTSEQYIYLMGLLRLYQSGIFTSEEAQTMFFLKVSKLMPRRFRKAEREALFSENVYRAASMINFYFKYVYENKKAFDKLDPALQEKISLTDPDDLPDTAEIRAVRKLKRHREVNAIYPGNLIQDIPGTKLKGYRFHLENEFLDTSLTAGQYVDAYAVFESWAEKNELVSLNLMCAILYQGNAYTAERAHQLLPETSKLPYDVKYAVMINFMSIHLYMAKQTKYVILFGGSGTDKKGKITLGFHDSIYSLIKSGYGDVEHMNLVKFLDLMLKELKDGVKALHDVETKIEDIASKTKLTIHQVKSLL